jgi:putative nucleotidyltransferase with HDIG domain
MTSNRIVLAGVGGPVDGLKWEASERLRIGRANNLDVVVAHPTISREHAEIFLGGSAWVVRDLGSHNGTFVNAVPVEQASRRLQLEDVIQCGDLSFRVSSLEVAPRPRAAGAINIKTSGEIVRVQAFAQRPWEQALEDLCRANYHLGQGSHFLTLIRAGHHLSRIHSLAKLLQTLLDDIVAVLDAQWGAIALVEESTRELVLRTVSTAPGKTKPGRCYSKTLAQRCFDKGESLLCADATNQDELRGSPSVFQGSMASIICAVLRSPRRRLGVLHLDRGPFQEPFTQEDFLLVDAIAANISVGIESAQGLEKQREQFVSEVTALAEMIIAGKNAELGRHSRAVSKYALIIAGELGLSEQDAQVVQAGSLFHDIGKIALPDALLNKERRLSAAEGEELRAHPARGADIAKTISCLEPVLPIIRHHHECWDGTGYPDGLAGEQIPKLSQIVALANALEHMTGTEKDGAPAVLDDILRNIKSEGGRRFDPDCVAALLRARTKIEAVFAATPNG